MKTVLLFLGATSVMGGEVSKAPEACAAPGASAKEAHTRFDPILLDLKGDGKRVGVECPVADSGPAAAGKDNKPLVNPPIKVSASQNGQTLRHAINTKGTGTSGRAAADHAINTKGTGAAGRSADANASCGDPVVNSSGESAAADARLKVRADHNTDGTIGARTEMAIKCKGTGAQ